MELDVLCVDGLLAGRCYALTDPERPHWLSVGEIPYRPVQGESGEWFFVYAEDLDAFPLEDWPESP